MTVPDVRIVALGTDPGGLAEHPETQPDTLLPIVVMGPSLGTSVTNLWGAVADQLAGQARVLGWDLPGHGGTPAASAEFSMSELARGVVTGLDAVFEAEGLPETERSFVYAGCSVGGCVGQQLLIDHPDRVRGAVLVATAQRVGTPEAWRERAELVAQAGTPTQVIGSAKRWFVEGFIARDAQEGTGVSTSLLHDLQDADRHGYAQVCEALATFDVHGELGGVRAPVTVVAGTSDVATPTDQLRELSEAIPTARYVEYDDAAHLPPAEVPQKVAGEIAAVLRELNPGAADPSGDHR